MGDVVVAREDREWAAKLLEGSSPYLEETDSRLWVESGEDFFDDVPEGDAELYYATAATIARVRIAAEQRGYERGVREERERCAGIVEAQALLCERDIAASPAILGAIVEMLRGLAGDMRGEHAKEGT